MRSYLSAVSDQEETWKSRYIRSSRIPSLWIISTELYQTEIRALLYIIPRFQARSRYFDLWYCRQKGHRVSKIRTPVKRLRYKDLKFWSSFLKLCFLLCSYSAKKFLFGKFLLGRKVLIWPKSSYWAHEFLLGTPFDQSERAPFSRSRTT